MTLPSCPPWCTLDAGHDLDQAPDTDGTRCQLHRGELRLAIARERLRAVELVRFDVVTDGGEVVTGTPELELDGEADVRMNLDEADELAQAITAVVAGARANR